MPVSVIMSMSVVMSVAVRLAGCRERQRHSRCNRWKKRS